MKKIIVLLILLLCPFFPVVASSSLIVNLNNNGVKPEYKEGEVVKIDYIYRNPFSEKKNLKIFCDFQSLDVEFPPMPDVTELELLPSQSSEKLSCEMKIYDVTPAGRYRGYVRVLDDKDKEVESQEIGFTVVGTKKMINIDTSFCVDKDCHEKKAVFISGDDIYLNIVGNVEDKNINLIGGDYSTQKEKELSLEVVSDLGKNGEIIKLNNDKVGSYYIRVEVSGVGYKKTQVENDYAIIAKPAEIKSSSVCEVNGECSGGETIKNCPQDCKVSLNKIETGEQKEVVNERNYRLLAFVIVILVIVLFATLVFYLLFVKSKKNDIM